MSELYVPCPKCRGSRYVSAIVRPSNGFTPTVRGEFPCDLCHMTGEADAERAAAWEVDQAELAEP